MAKKGEIAQAAVKINEFGVKHNEKDVLELFNKLKEQRDFLDRESMAHVNREVTKATKELATEGAKKDEIKKKLEAFLPGLEGYKKALEKLTTYIATIK